MMASMRTHSWLRSFSLRFLPSCSECSACTGSRTTCQGKRSFVCCDISCCWSAFQSSCARPTNSSEAGRRHGRTSWPGARPRISPLYRPLSILPARMSPFVTRQVEASLRSLLLHLQRILDVVELGEFRVPQLAIDPLDFANVDRLHDVARIRIDRHHSART